MAKIIAVGNQKGGVGKTTTTAAMAAGLKNRGYHVLVIDLDPQGNLSASVGADSQELPTTYDLLKMDAAAGETIQTLTVFDVIPANIQLSFIEQELTDLGKEQRLKEVLAPVMNQYDYILIDTLPALGLLTINAFTAANEIIIPTTAGIFAATGIKQLYDTILRVRKYCYNDVKIAGVLLTRFDPRANNNRDMQAVIRKLCEHIETKIFDTYIRTSIAIEEAQARKADIFSYRANSTVAQDYDTFISEYLLKEKN